MQKGILFTKYQTTEQCFMLISKSLKQELCIE